MGVRALVTGATGFIGGHVVDALLREGHDVTALVRPTSDTRRLQRVGARLAVGDVTDPGSLRAACDGQKWLFHTAAVVGNVGSWKHFHDVGVRGTQRVIDASASAGVERFVHLSSITVYGTRPRRGCALREETPFDESPEPWNNYVREKVLSEKLLWKAHDEGKVQATSLRPSIVVGPRDRNVIPRTLSILRSPAGALIGSGDNRVPVVVVEELASAIVRAARDDVAIGRAYNLSGSRPMTQREYFAAFAAAAGLRAPTRTVPLPVAMLGAAALEGAWRIAARAEEPFLTRLVVALAGHDWTIDCARAASELGWRGDADYTAAIRRSVSWQSCRDDAVEMLAPEAWGPAERPDAMAAPTPSLRSSPLD
jgi:nucleoside-diphosphate-sugar epimerase